MPQSRERAGLAGGRSTFPPWKRSNLGQPLGLLPGEPSRRGRVSPAHPPGPPPREDQRVSRASSKTDTRFCAACRCCAGACLHPQHLLPSCCPSLAVGLCHEQSQALLGSMGQAGSEWLCSQLACCFGVERSLLELRWCAQNQLCFLSVLAAVSLMTKISPIPLPSPGTRSFLSAAAVLPCAAHGPPYGCKTQNEVSSISSAQQHGAEW